MCPVWGLCRRCEAEEVQFTSWARPTGRHLTGTPRRSRHWLHGFSRIVDHCRKHERHSASFSSQAASQRTHVKTFLNHTHSTTKGHCRELRNHFYRKDLGGRSARTLVTFRTCFGASGSTMRPVCFVCFILFFSCQLCASGNFTTTRKRKHFQTPLC